MKKSILLVSAIVMTFAASALATEGKKAQSTSKPFSRPYGMAGCGLGSMALGKSGGQIFAATTNGTSFNQYFGITMGTSNCVDSPNNEIAQSMDIFVASNQAALAGDMARGGGEALTHLSVIMGCEANVDQVGTAMQKNFREIFPNTKVQPNEVTDSIITVIQQNGLSANCKKIS